MSAVEETVVVARPGLPAPLLNRLLSRSLRANLRTLSRVLGEHRTSLPPRT
jgi:hypothetical protein